EVQVRARLFDAGVAEQADELAGFDRDARLDPARNRREVEVLRVDGAVAVRDADVEAAVLLVGAALHAIDHALVHRVHRLAPALADVDAAVAGATLGGPIAGPLGAEHAAVANRHASRRAVERMEPGVGRDLREPVLFRRRPRRAVRL